MKSRIIKKRKGDNIKFYIQSNRFKLWLYCYTNDLVGALFYLFFGLLFTGLIFVHYSFIMFSIIALILSINIFSFVKKQKFDDIKQANDFITDKEKPKQKIVKTTKIHYTAKDLRKSKLNKINGG